MTNLLRDTEVGNRLALFERVLAASSEGITISEASNSDYPIVYVNQGFERITGYSSAEVLGQNFRFLQGPDTDPQVVEKIRLALQDDREITAEILNYRKDGAPFWNRVSITPVRDSSGTVTHHIGVQSDITKRKEAEQERESAMADLEFANRRMRHNMAAAARMQEALLPKSPFEARDARFAWRVRPSEELAGDFLNVYRLNERDTLMYIIDVSGHGTAAALLSFTAGRFLSGTSRQSILYARDSLEAGQRELNSPTEVAERLNEYFPFDPRTAKFFTLVFGILEGESSTFRYVSAGHPPPILVPRTGETRVLPGSGPPIGIFSAPKFEEFAIDLVPGDRLYLYTDGVTETESPADEEFGVERIIEILEASRGLRLGVGIDAVLDAAAEWSGSASQADDASMVALEVAE